MSSYEKYRFAKIMTLVEENSRLKRLVWGLWTLVVGEGAMIIYLWLG